MKISIKFTEKEKRDLNPELVSDILTHKCQQMFSHFEVVGSYYPEKCILIITFRPRKQLALNGGQAN